ncbi:MAG: cytochrome b/b6 domain-containing protein [Pseudomonadota bacterium]
METTIADKKHKDGRILTYRHKEWVRICHWITAICVLTLLVTGVFILLSHPRLYWGEDGFFGDPAFISFGNWEWANLNGISRSYHFLAAWILVITGAVYVVLSLAKGYARKTLLPSKDQLKPSHLWSEFKGHAQFKIARGDEARRYNVFQKISYIVVLFIFLPLMVLSGLAMSPAVTASYPEIFSIFGGRQSARTIHFLIASALLLFFLVHMFQVVLVGFKDSIRAMTTGWHALPPVIPPKTKAKADLSAEGETK